MLPSPGLGQRRPYYAPETSRLVRRIQASQQQTCRPAPHSLRDSTIVIKVGVNTPTAVRGQEVQEDTGTSARVPPAGNPISLTLVAWNVCDQGRCEA